MEVTTRLNPHPGRSLLYSAMSLISWLAKANPAATGRFPEPKKPFLPNPNNEDHHSDGVVCAAANEEIELLEEPSKRRKRGAYNHYSEDLRLKIARYANDNGLSSASRHFTKEFGHPVE